MVHFLVKDTHDNVARALRVLADRVHFRLENVDVAGFINGVVGFNRHQLFRDQKGDGG